MMPPLLSVNNLKWNIKDKSILDVEKLAIYSGDHLALIGPNGSGKSSLVKILAYLEQPSSGSVVLNIPEIGSSLVNKRRQMGVVFQEALLLNMTVKENIAYGLKLRKLRHGLNERVEYWLEKLKIAHLANRYPKNLSGGEAQRTSIARALALEPKILFLDEPFSSLDAPTKAQMLEDIGGIIKQAQITSVFITHDFSDIPFMANKVMVISQGELVQQGSWEDILNQPVNEDVANLVGADVQLKGEIIKAGENLEIKLEKGYVISAAQNNSTDKITIGQKVQLFIRPEEVALNSGAEKANTFQGEVQKISPYGFQYKLTVDCGFPLKVVIDKAQFLNEKPFVGSRVKLQIAPERIHLINQEK